MQLVDDPIVISWSEIDAYRQCPFKHHLAYRERWRSDEDKEVLARGTAWHEVLEARYLGQTERIPRLLGQEADQLQTERQELLEWMYEGYCQQWEEADRDWQIKAVEFKGFAPLPNPSGGPSRFILKVKIDLVAALRGRLWIWDHKSGRNLPSDKELDLDDQFGLYMWCMRQMGYPVLGALYNAARTQRNKSFMELDTRFSRTLMSRTNIELDTIAMEAYQTAEAMWSYDPEVDSTPPRHPNTDTCRWRCDFTEACLSSRKGGRLEDMLHAHGYQRHPFREVELEYKEYRVNNG